jgi:hypothetical protein
VRALALSTATRRASGEMRALNGPRIPDISRRHSGLTIRVPLDDGVSLGRGVMVREEGRGPSVPDTEAATIRTVAAAIAKRTRFTRSAYDPCHFQHRG